MKAAIRFRLYVGLERSSDITVVQEQAAKALEYATVFETAGIYAGEIENSAVVEVVEYFSPTAVDVTLRQLGARLCRTLNQESYGLTRESVEVAFVEVADGEVG